MTGHLHYFTSTGRGYLCACGERRTRTGVVIKVVAS